MGEANFYYLPCLKKKNYYIDMTIAY